jgi:hypothetical protein
MKDLQYISEERCEHDTILYDYTHAAYNSNIPIVGKLRSSNIFYNSFTDSKKLVPLVRETTGEDATIWGIKLVNHKLYYELYFYKENMIKEYSAIDLIAGLKKYIHIDVNSHIPCDNFMFSVDVNNQISTGIHVYLATGNDNSGVSYYFKGDNIRLENIYTFYDPKYNYTKLVRDVKESAFSDINSDNLNNVLIPELINCKNICRGRKQGCDSIYFSGINIDQFLYFLKRFDYPRAIVQFIEDRKSDLDHLQYDVGFDYTLLGGELIINKSGYYGTF